MKAILLIIILQLLYVPLLTMRTIFMVRNYSILASILGFFEAIVYIFGLSIIIKDDQPFIAMLIYAISFGFGIFLGNKIERKLYIGYSSYHISLKNKNQSLINKLREQNFGVTVFEGEGCKGKRYKLDILINKQDEKKLMKIVKDYEPHAFIISFYPINFKRRYNKP
ncbi:DUF5698 domain-containing protein [Clostridiaceae bacterium M8S5]|nr:DUF5698 domain-containing protein [Clostridiaceae bacterium M8S5]